MNERTLTWKDLASIEIGGAVCLPVILIGHRLVKEFGLIPSLIGIAIGNLFLFLLACLMAHMSYQYKLNTSENAKRYFGEKGVILVALCVSFMKTCWFGIQLTLMVETLAPAKGAFQMACELILGTAIVLIAMKGLKALKLISEYSLPFLVFTMAILAYQAMGREAQSNLTPFSLEPISLVIATAISAVIDMPTYFRFSCSLKDSFSSIALLFLVAIPCIEGVGVYLAAKSSSIQFFESLLGPNLLWNIWIGLFILLAGWTTNNTNLYSGAVAFSTVFRKIPEKIAMLLLGGTAIAFAMLGILDHFRFVLQIMGICMGSIGAVILINYVCKMTNQHQVNVLAWFLGVAAGLASCLHLISLTGIPLLDAFIVSSSLCIVMIGVEKVQMIKKLRRMTHEIHTGL